MHGGAVSKRQAEKEAVTSARARSIFFGNRLIVRVYGRGARRASAPGQAGVELGDMVIFDSLVCQLAMG